MTPWSSAINARMSQSVKSNAKRVRRLGAPARFNLRLEKEKFGAKFPLDVPK